MCKVCNKDSGKYSICFGCWLKTKKTQPTPEEMDGAESLYEEENDPANFEEADNNPW